MTRHQTMGVTDIIRTLDAGLFRTLVLKGEGRIAVEFMSDGCGYCRTIEPILRQVAEMVAGEETIFRVHVGAAPELASEYDVGGTPTFLMFLNGQEVGQAERPDPTLSAVTNAVTGPFVS